MKSNWQWLVGSFVFVAMLLPYVAVFAPRSANADTFNWTGAEDTDFNSSGNWTTNGAVADQVPPDGSDIVIDTGAVNITTGLDQSAKDFPTLVIGPNYTGEVGNSTSDPLKCGMTKFVCVGGRI